MRSTKNLDIEKISKENQELRESLRSKTIELEQKNRDLEIEAALECVRAKTMAMQKSEELKEVIQVVYYEFVHLKIDVEHTGFIMDYKEREDMYIWLADHHEVPSQITVPYFDSPHWNSFIEAKKNGTDFFVNLLSFEEKNKFYKELFTLIPGLPEETMDYYFNCPGLAGSTVLLDNVSLYIENFKGIPYTDEENKILMRFGKVFQQTYTRFLDLQKAEAQAREAQIEASLERVRSRTMAMHKSDELREAGAVLYRELTKLGITSLTIGYVLMDKSKKIGWNYTANPADGTIWEVAVGIPHDETDIMRRVAHSWKEQEPFSAIKMDAEQTIAHQTFIAERGINFPYTAKELISFSPEKIVLSNFNFTQGYLMIVGDKELQPEQEEMMVRFTNVFQQTYTRFLDLQKAEKQAKEAKIEAALEKVRSVSLSLKKSEDMLEVAQALYEQLLALGFTNIRNSIIDIDNADGATFLDYDYSHEMGGTVTLMSYEDDPTLKELLEDIIATTDGFSEIILEGKQLQDLIEMRRKNGEADDPRLLKTDSLSYILYAFGNGAIGISNFGILNENEKVILNRFRNVFTFAYKRYNDLAQAENQAKALLDEKQRLEITLSDLQATQKQLIQSEKMASLGELTAGIAHEIKNPLNFINNFSEVNKEMIAEMKEEIEKGNYDEVKIIANDIEANEDKINHHGKRADAIVKGMLQHSRTSSAEKEPTDINMLADEYLRLAYHGLRAKDKSFNATLGTGFDESIGPVNVIPQDIGRVILNLITNAFYALAERKNTSEDKNFKPTVSVLTKKLKDTIEIIVKDNGNGIPKNILDKIFQPFFTTKPTGQGTGLGLSLSYDIIKAHGGELTVKTKEGKGTEFILLLPIKDTQ